MLQRSSAVDNQAVDTPLQIPSMQVHPGCTGISVVSFDSISLMFEVRGDIEFLRRAEAKLMRGTTGAKLNHKPIRLHAAKWTYPIGNSRLRVMCGWSMASAR